DPAANGYTFDGDRRLWATEVCDPVQAGSYRIEGNGLRVPVSNFVLPAYFNPWGHRPFDHLAALDGPFTIGKGGYATFERATATQERDGKRKRFDTVFDDAMPQWKQRQKLEGWGRTWWRRKLNP